MSKTEFNKVVKRAVYGVKDYHVSVRFTDYTAYSSLPFRITATSAKAGKRRYFIESFQSNAVYGLEVGDEVIRFDGRRLDNIVRDILDEQGAVNRLETDWELASKNITLKRMSRGDDLATGEAELLVIKKNGKRVKVKAPWNVNITPNMVTNQTEETEATPELGLKLLNTKMVSERALSSFQPSDSQAAYNLGARNSYVPTLGKVIWEAPATSPFKAYTFELPNGEVGGYIRIPAYSLSGPDFMYFLNTMRFGDLINKLEQETDRLVVDQVDNPGGSVFYLYTLASMFASQGNLKIPQHQEINNRASRDSYLQDAESISQQVTDDAAAKQLFGSNLHGYNVDKQFALDYVKYLRTRAQDASENKHLTSVSPLFGVAEIKPHKDYQYTKPVLLLIDELGFSGGDFFPAIMQDNGRMTLMGQNTAGAGGYVNQKEIGKTVVGYTGSLAFRTNGQPIENLGVTPDIPYYVSAKDYQTGFAPMKSAVVKNLMKLK